MLGDGNVARGMGRVAYRTAEELTTKQIVPRFGPFENLPQIPSSRLQILLPPTLNDDPSLIRVLAAVHDYKDGGLKDFGDLGIVREYWLSGVIEELADIAEIIASNTKKFQFTLGAWITGGDTESQGRWQWWATTIEDLTQPHPGMIHDTPWSWNTRGAQGFPVHDRIFGELMLSLERAQGGEVSPDPKDAPGGIDLEYPILVIHTWEYGYFSGETTPIQELRSRYPIRSTEYNKQVQERRKKKKVIR